ncbi:MFS transporter [Archangium violaceum]|uniref:MFS transporter n=1 Tax=Archangium violaceum TaxID=83451 RepID=UPI002B2EC10F|nr:MFS transporter [Archangium gephyra]
MTASAVEQGGGKPAPRLWANANFRVLFVGQTVSLIGDGVSFAMFPLLVLALTGSGTQMGLVGALEMLPAALFSPIAGALADRWDRRRIMMWCNLARAVLIGLVPLAGAMGVPVLPVIYAVTIPFGALNALFNSAYFASLPAIVGHEALASATSTLMAARWVGNVFGPALAGFIAARWNPQVGLALDALTFLVAYAALHFTRGPFQGAPAASRGSLFGEVREGLEYAAGQPVLVATMLLSCGVEAVTYQLVPMTTFLTQVDRGLPPSSFGLLVAVFGAGMLPGLLLVPRLSRGRVWPVILLANLVAGLALALLALSGQLAPMLVASALCGGANSLSLSLLSTRWARLTPNEMLGRVGSLYTLAARLAGPVSAVTVGAVLDRAGGVAALGMAAAFLVFLTVAFALSPSFRGASESRSPGPSAG